MRAKVLFSPVLELREKHKRAENHVRAILRALGDDPTREGLQETPKRVVRSWEKLYGGYRQDPTELLKTFAQDCDEMVVVKDIEFYSTCEHHMQPFFGKAHVGYLPSGRVVGLSKIPRLIEVYSRRLQIQERVGQQVTEALMKYLKPKGCGVVIEARHFCMCARGVEKQNSVAITSSMQGVFRDNGPARDEFLRLIGK